MDEYMFFYLDFNYNLKFFLRVILYVCELVYINFIIIKVYICFWYRIDIIIYMYFM